MLIHVFVFVTLTAVVCCERGTSECVEGDNTLNEETV
jgi:hypothetical protein